MPMFSHQPGSRAFLLYETAVLKWDRHHLQLDLRRLEHSQACESPGHLYLTLSPCSGHRCRCVGQLRHKHYEHQVLGDHIASAESAFSSGFNAIAC